MAEEKKAPLIGDFAGPAENSPRSDPEKPKDPAPEKNKELPPKGKLTPEELSEAYKKGL